MQQKILPSLFELHGSADGLAFPHHLEVHYIADFAAAQSICEIVQIVNRRIPKLNENISGLESSLGRRRSRANIGKFDAVFFLSEIRNGSEIGAIAAAASAGHLTGRVVFDDRDKRGALGRGIEF